MYLLCKTLFRKEYDGVLIKCSICYSSYFNKVLNKLIFDINAMFKNILFQIMLQKII